MEVAMDTATTSIESVPRTIIQNQVDYKNLSSFFYERELASSNEKFTETKTRLATLLQSSLDPQVILDMFYKELLRLMDLEGLQYKHQSHNLNVDIAQQNLYRCSYRLFNGKEYLGELTLYRQSKFNEYHLELIEAVAGYLLFPIRNAIHYRSALTASLTDPLTGAGNRTGLERHLSREIDLARRHGASLSILMIDIDNFKAINDQYGHSVGDTVIVSVINTLMKANRQTDLCFRYGGEEFVVVLSKTPQLGAELIANRFRRSVQQLHTLPEQEQRVTVSIGVTDFRANDDLPTLMSRSDQALYRAKHGGKNRVVVAL